MKLEILKRKKFDLEMKDYWTVCDRMEYAEITKEINDLKRGNE